METTFTFDTFRGHIAKSFLLIALGFVPRRYPHDCKVSETGLTVLSDQDVALDGLSISVRVHPTLRFAYRTDATV